MSLWYIVAWQEWHRKRILKWKMTENMHASYPQLLGFHYFNSWMTSLSHSLIILYLLANCQDQTFWSYCLAPWKALSTNPDWKRKGKENKALKKSLVYWCSVRKSHMTWIHLGNQFSSSILSLTWPYPLSLSHTQICPTFFLLNGTTQHTYMWNFNFMNHLNK